MTFCGTVRQEAVETEKKSSCILDSRYCSFSLMSVGVYEQMFEGTVSSCDLSPFRISGSENVAPLKYLSLYTWLKQLSFRTAPEASHLEGTSFLRGVSRLKKEAHNQEEAQTFHSLNRIRVE